eukprot:4616542-Alexandrium_andersonii.AAC.1
MLADVAVWASPKSRTALSSSWNSPKVGAPSPNRGPALGAPQGSVLNIGGPAVVWRIPGL